MVYLTFPFLQDILNNLDSCDLEDDDLMLDVDLPEDPPRDKGKEGSQAISLWNCFMGLRDF